MKKLITSFLTIPLTLGLLVQPVHADGNLKLQYEIRDGKAYVVGYKGKGDTAEIKDTYKGKQVVGIADEAFKDCDTLYEIENWASIEELGNSCFENCTSLQEVDFVNVKSIGDHAFQGCYNLEEVDFWDVEEIGDYAFAGCRNLEEMDIPMCTTYIGDHAFEDCTDLEELDIHGVLEIGEYAFNNCSELEEVEIPRETKIVRTHAFSDCTRLKKVKYNKNTKFEVNAFEGCFQLNLPIRYISVGDIAKYPRKYQKVEEDKKEAKTEVK